MQCYNGMRIAQAALRPSAVPVSSNPASTSASRMRRISASDILTSGGRVLCAVGLGKNVSEAQARAYALVDQISWQGMQCRRDIGFRAVARESTAG